MKERYIGIDLLKILSMFMIVVLHVLNKGGAIEHAHKLGINYILYYVMFMISYTSVNIFATITGYLMVNSKWKLSNYIKLYMQVIFYSLSITSIGFIFLEKIQVC